MRSYDHIALAEFFISSPLVLVIPIVFWFFYNLKVINFNGEKIRQNENEFIFCFMLFPVSKQWWMAIRVVLIQLLPLFVYGLFLSLLAWKHEMMNSIIVILIALMILVIISAYHLLWSLRGWLESQGASVGDVLVATFYVAEGRVELNDIISTGG